MTPHTLPALVRAAMRSPRIYGLRISRHQASSHRFERLTPRKSRPYPPVGGGRHYRQVHRGGRGDRGRMSAKPVTIQLRFDPLSSVTIHESGYRDRSASVSAPAAAGREDRPAPSCSAAYAPGSRYTSAGRPRARDRGSPSAHAEGAGSNLAIRERHLR
ncbi:hypothetical protein T261_8143 [Streptomyces lydicus]|nr:hypothetical protein T261_8143 [Streptomyces lydicus]